MNVSKTDFLFIYDSNDLQQREALGYVTSLPKRKLRTLDVQKESLTERQLAQLSQKLQLRPYQMLKEEAMNQQNGEDSLSQEDVLTLLHKNPELMQTPILEFEDSAEILDSGYDAIRREMDSLSPSAQSANQQENTTTNT